MREKDTERVSDRWIEREKGMICAKKEGEYEGGK